MFEKWVRSFELVIASFTGNKLHPGCQQVNKPNSTHSPSQALSQITRRLRRRANELSVMTTSTSTSPHLAAHQPCYLSGPLPRDEGYGMACLHQCSTVPAHEPTYSHSRPYHAANIPVLLNTSRRKVGFTTETLISS
jgi:hypothetical protein